MWCDSGRTRPSSGHAPRVKGLYFYGSETEVPGAGHSFLVFCVSGVGSLRGLSLLPRPVPRDSCPWIRTGPNPWFYASEVDRPIVLTTPGLHPPRNSFRRVHPRPGTPTRPNQGSSFEEYRGTLVERVDKDLCCREGCVTRD